MKHVSLHMRKSRYSNIKMTCVVPIYKYEASKLRSEATYPVSKANYFIIWICYF